MPWKNPRTQASKPPEWWPRAGWGTVRGYRIENRDGRVNLAFYFVPDDGSKPRLVQITDTFPPEELGEYARCIMHGDDDLTIKVSAESVARAERTFQGINQMELSKRKIMFADRSDIDGDCGWAWTSDYTLVKVAPGLLD